MDRALLGPDSTASLDLPTQQGEQEISEQHLNGLNLTQRSSVYWPCLSEVLSGFCGSDNTTLYKEAKLHST